MRQFTTISDPDSISYPMATSEAHALAIAKESSFEYVFSVFHDYLHHNPEFDLILSPKYGLILIQNTAKPRNEPQLDFFLVNTGYELCYYILRDLALTAYYELVNGKDVCECSEEEEQEVRKRIKFFTDQFPFTSEVVLIDLFNRH